MTLTKLYLPKIVFSAPAEGAPAADPAPAVPPAAAPAAAPAPAAKWWEAEPLKNHKDLLEAKGLTVNDQTVALAKLAEMYRGAETRLGKPADQLMDRPGKDQPIAEFMRKHGDTFGIPETAEGYKIDRPQDWPKDAPWNEAFENTVRQIAHDEGVPQSALNKLVQAYAADNLAVMQNVEGEYTRANEAMMADLRKDWGDQTEQKILFAQQAAAFLGEQAGVDKVGIENMGAALKDKVGDAATIKIFAKIGEMLGDDTFVAGRGSSFTTTPAEARAELQRRQTAGGDYYEAVNKNDTEAVKRMLPDIERLQKIAAQ